MKISATGSSEAERHDVCVRPDEKMQALLIPPKPAGGGSAINGGEFLSCGRPLRGASD
jgi:hypothetical protein